MIDGLYYNCGPIGATTATFHSENLTMKSEMTSRQFAATDPLFRKCCELAGIQPTKRQASKFRSERGKGKARQFVAAASQLVAKGE